MPYYVTLVTFSLGKQAVKLSVMKNNRAESVIKAVAANLALLRKKRGLSHDMLAARAGITRASVSFIESGKRKPTLLLLLKLAHALDIRLSELLSEAENRVDNTPETRNEAI